MQTFQFGQKTLSNNTHGTYVIAEIGVNHEGDLNLAKRLIDLCREGGADAAKFQAYKADRIAAQESPAYWDTTKEKTLNQRQLFQKYDMFGPKEYAELAQYCAKVGIDFMCTAFDEDYVDMIDPLVRIHKIASADLTNIPMLRQIAKTGKPVVLSTGAASFVEIRLAVEELRTHGAKEICLLHCVLNYPCPQGNAHLARLATLKEYFPDCLLGYSDHTEPDQDCLPLTVAYTMGARVIEKHFTHDKTLPGNDHYHAMDVHDLKSIRAHFERTAALLGSGTEKDFLNVQGAAICHARRSIVSKGKIAQGQRLTVERLTVKRPGCGISPLEWDQILNGDWVATHDIQDDTILQWPLIKRVPR